MKYKLGLCPPGHDDLETAVANMEIMKEVGFDAVFLPVKPYKPAHSIALCDAAKRIGLEIDELHAPFTNINRMWYDEPIGDPVMQMLKDSIDLAAECGAPRIVVHDCAGRIHPGISRAGLARFREVIAHGKEKGVRVCMENLRDTNTLAYILKENEDLGVGYCWDCGHELCYTPGVDHVAMFGDKLACTHIHDNRGIYMGDDHMLPFDGGTDWEKKAALIKRAGYTGILSLELAKGRFYEEMTDEAFIKEAYKRITKFAAMCE